MATAKQELTDPQVQGHPDTIDRLVTIAVRIAERHDLFHGASHSNVENLASAQNAEKVTVEGRRSA